MTNKRQEPNTAPNPDQWYTLTLGSSFKDHHQPSSKFYSLRYDFQPSSVDKTQPGVLHKTKDNKISVEFQNNQIGKPKVIFESTIEDYKENDAVLFFDGSSFRLEKLHRAVKRLRHVRLPGESSVSSGSAVVGDGGSPLLAKGGKGQGHGHGFSRGGHGFPAPQTQQQPQPQSQHQPQQQQQQQQQLPLPPPPPLPPVSVEVERIDIGDAGNSGGYHKTDKTSSTPPQQPNVTVSPDSKDFDLEEHLDIMNDDEDDDALGPNKDSVAEKPIHTGIDINMPQQNDTDDEIADVDVNDDNAAMGGNAAAALRAQVNAVEKDDRTSSSSASSGSESSSSGSGSGSGSSHSSSDSESSDGDSVTSI